MVPPKMRENCGGLSPLRFLRAARSRAFETNAPHPGGTGRLIEWDFVLPARSGGGPSLWRRSVSAGHHTEYRALAWSISVQAQSSRASANLGGGVGSDFNNC